MRVRTWLSIAIVLLAGPSVASAHSTLQAVGTAKSMGLRLSFSAPVEGAFLRLDNGRGDRRAASVDPADDQTIVITTPAGGPLDIGWRVLSRDGHVSEGRLYATSPVVRESATRNVLSVAADAVAFAALLGLIGLIGVRFGVIGPAWTAGGTSPPGASASERWRQTVDPSLRRGIALWWRTWWACASVAAIGLPLAVTGMLTELDSWDVGALAGTHWGIAWLVQTVGLAVAAAVAWRWGRSPCRSRPDPPRGWGYALAVPLAVAAAAIAWSGHASSGTDAAIGIGIDTLHLWATGVWLGGLVALLAIVPRARRGLADADATRLGAGVVVRFSALAIVCVGTLVVTGVYRAIGELTAVDDLVDTGYGQVLLAKLIVFAMLLTGGAYNRLVLHPRLERAALGLRDTDRGAGQALRTSVTAELALAAILLVVVAVLVNLPPP